MRAFVEIFVLQLRELVRGRVAALLAVASVAWLFVLPHVLKGDGTAAGMREVYLRYALGGVFALLVISLIASATGALAGDRAAKRLQLTQIRPVRALTIVLARYAAIVSLGAAVLALSAVLTPLGLRAALAQFGPQASSAAFVRCSHVLKPVMPPAREEALRMYDAYMADPSTPAEIRRASKSSVVRLLENKAIDHYQTIHSNEVVRWVFPSAASACGDLAVRLRFTNTFNMRKDVRGVFRLGNRRGDVSSITQAVLTVPLADSESGAATNAAASALTFENRGANAIMLRPRRDLDLLVPADGFCWNLLRAWAELVAVLAILVAFGVFLGAGLGRPVALFVAMVTLAVSEMSPSVIEQYPNEFTAGGVDRIGLFLTRLAASVTHPVSALSPLDHLSKDECVECREVARAVAMDVVAVPVLLAFLAALVMPRKEEA